MCVSLCFVPFIVLLAIVLALNYTLNFISDITSLIGSTVVLLTISWQLTKCVHRYVADKKPISSYKKAVLVTGCDTGFGNQLAFKLNSNGFMVYATVLDPESDGAIKLASNCEFPRSMKVMKMNVTSDADVIAVYEHVCSDLQQSDHQLWGLVNNAGALSLGAIDWGNLKTLEHVFAVNVFGLVRVTRTFLPLIRQSKGRIVNVSSIAGKLALPFVGYYSMSKFAVNSFSDALRRETHKFGISVSIVSISAGFNTNMANPSDFTRLVHQLWNDTDASVKRIYGDQYDDHLVNVLTGFISIVCDKLELVNDVIIDALVSNSPKINYTVATGWSSHLAVLALDYMPTELIDKLMHYALNKIKLL